MNAVIRKELRLLLPGFVLGLLLACSVWLWSGRSYATTGIRAALVVIPFVVSPVVLILMTLSSFGRELSAGTFSQLLAQPVARSRVWRTKTLLLAAAVVLIWAVWWISLSHHPEFLARPREEQRDTFLTTVLFVVAAYSGGLWTALLIRQFAAAFWLTLLAPAALATTIVGAFSRESDIIHPLLRPALIIAFSLYGVGGFLFARWLFLRAQDTHWTGGTIALPSVRGLARLFRRRGERRQWRPCAALWVKELQLHQSQFVIAGVLALLHLAAIATRKLGGGFKDHPALEFPLEQFWVLWLAMPLLVGCTTVAEERRLGTLESQLCLPSRRRTQFFIKLVSALLLSVVLGAAMPLLFEGNNILSGFQTESDTNVANYVIRTPQGTLIPIGGILAFIRVLLPFLTLAGIVAVIAILSLYASSLARNTIQALTPAVLGVLTAWSLFFAASAPNIVYPLWRGGLIYLVGLPVMLLTFTALTCWNFKRVLVGWAVWRRNTFALLAAVAGVMTATSATYHRVWEHFMTLEPEHGPARLNQSVTLQSSYFHVAVQFLDGRNWSSRLDVSTPNWIALLTGSEKVTSAPGSAGYLEGTNWVSAARSYRDVIGIQNDGSLWVSVSELPKPEPRPIPPSPSMIRLGQDSDWKSVVAPGAQAFLLKTNGTLWRLGRSSGNWKDWPGFGAFTPVRVGADSDWASLSFGEHGRIVLEKADGRAWIRLSSSQPDSDTEEIQVDAELTLARAPYLEGQKSVARIWTVGPPGRKLELGVGEDGVLRVIGYWGSTKTTNRLGTWHLIPISIQLGQETNWLALANEQDALVGLKTDGTLWRLIFSTDPITQPEGFSAVSLSRHSDWVGLTAMMDRIVSLAADGSLWYWAMEDPYRYARGFSFQPLLAPSRRPQLIGNVFPSPGQ